MTTTEPDLPLELDEDLVAPPHNLGALVLGRLPRLPGSPRPPTPPPPTESAPASPVSGPPLDAPPGPGSGRSSTGSTDRAADPVDPKDFRDAIRQGVDIGFVLGGQFIGTVHARRSGEERDANRWKPTRTERRRVADPAHRIARRHIANSADAMDAIDVALMAAGVGAYVSRAGFNLDELEDLDADTT